MPTIILYLLKVIICSGMLYGYYRLFLRNKVFHRWNRFYLLIAVVISISFPLVRINIEPGTATAETSQVVRMLQVINTGEAMIADVDHRSPLITGEQAAGAVYLVISLLMMLLLVHALLKVYRLIRQYPANRMDGMYVVSSDAKGTPFSFFRYIFWNNKIDITTDAGQKIFKHEMVHVQEKHSADRLFMNMVLVFFWSNPFFWLIRREMNMIHEFIADSKAVGGHDTTSFAAMIIRTAYPQHNFDVTSNFFSSSIKRRLFMLTKLNKPGTSYLGRVLALPLLAFVFIAFTLKMKNNPAVMQLDKPITVVIDAGHGGDDGGAWSDRVYEKDITLTLAKKVKALNNNPAINILLTRETDIHQPVREKVTWSLQQQPDAFISIHVGANPSYSDKSPGFELHISKNSGAKETKVRTLASLISEEINTSYAVFPQLKQHREKGIWVLDAPEIDYPAILIECGYLTNKKDLAFISDAANQEKIARNILKAIERYAKAVENGTGTAVWEEVPEASFASSGNKGETFSAVPDTLPRKIKSVDITKDGMVIVIYNDNKAEKITRNEAISKGILKAIPNEEPAEVRPPFSLGDVAANTPVYVNGKEIDPQELDRIDPSCFENISILKGPYDQLGERGKNGAIVIITINKLVKYKDQPTPKVSEEDKVFHKTEVEATYPGGEQAWLQYIQQVLNKNLDALKKENKSGTCVVQFIVGTDGSISNIEVLTMQDTKLAELAAEAIKNGPKWIPAKQNGHIVKAYRRQPVTFLNKG
ncbi:MAG: N-acetylmuramoyl-L-alanine amidase [Chitinophagaceae bacterium]|nr:N-acetylmuramoyl-L-alanine amidase [Chitinophagaceae bacterium]MCW5928592.1 N-acetylmuramoyl-L-alanine amidase [Chitinophagaceae bacterium]